MHMAVLGAKRRIIGLSSDVATTETTRDRDALSVSSRKSRTSRLRSPTSARTVTSLEGARLSMANNVDLPTPEPAKIPIRCPAQIGVKRSIALTPVVSASPNRLRRSAAGGLP
jgi:hypothetical protein